MSNANELLISVKRKIRVTWSHEDDDILEMIEDGISYLQSKAGELPFELSDKSDLANNSRRLLKTYCRYEWNGTGAYFETDYLSDILSLQIDAAIWRRKKHEK